MNIFIPDKAYVDPRCLNYPSGREAVKYLTDHHVPIINSKKVDIDNKSVSENYAEAKRTILLTVTTQRKLRPCSPSADFQFALSSSCPGHCEYCYLQTTQGEKPYIKVFVNIEDILNVIEEHIRNNMPEITFFECGSITDPIATEHFTGNLKKCIEFFAGQEYGRLRVITKFDNIDSFLGINHNKHTKFRFSVNTERVIKSYEHNTASFEERIAAASKIAEAGYPIGFVIAPIMLYDNWKKDYENLILTLKDYFKDYKDEITFELIQHRFTAAAKELILQRFPKTTLDMNTENRLLKWGPYGKFKYVYPKEKSSEIKDYISELISSNIKNTLIEYFT